MKYKNKEAEMEYKDLRSRFLGMIIGCAIGEIVGRESLVYIGPDDDAEKKLLAGLSGSSPEAIVKTYQPGKITELLNGACKTFLEPLATAEPGKCWPNQLFFRVAPVAFISEAQSLDVSSTVSMALQELLKTHTDPFAVLPPVSGFCC